MTDLNEEYSKHSDAIKVAAKLGLDTIAVPVVGQKYHLDGIGGAHVELYLVRRDGFRVKMAIDAPDYPRTQMHGLQVDREIKRHTLAFVYPSLDDLSTKAKSSRVRLSMWKP